jgi:hypothetical protein
MNGTLYVTKSKGKYWRWGINVQIQGTVKTKKRRKGEKGVYGNTEIYWPQAWKQYTIKWLLKIY